MLFMLACCVIMVVHYTIFPNIKYIYLKTNDEMTNCSFENKAQYRGLHTFQNSINENEISTPTSKQHNVQKKVLYPTNGLVTQTTSKASDRKRNLIYEKVCGNNKLYKSLLDIKRNNTKEIESYLATHCLEKLPNCNKTLVGSLKVNIQVISLNTLYINELSFVKHGGWWSPEDCTGYTSTAVIIPFRERYEHLNILLRHLHPMLKRQQLHYRIFVIEQDDKNGFNRGKVRNVGFNEALRIFPYSCVVFHDIDLIPEDDRIHYACTSSPMHLSAAVSKFGYRLPYHNIFGGVQMFIPNDYKKANGFSNIFYSWGAEDDAMFWRIRNEGMNIHRFPIKIARYTKLHHESNSVNRTKKDEEQTDKLYVTSHQHRKEDGLNSLQYKVNKIVENQLFTLVKVDLQKHNEKNFGLNI